LWAALIFAISHIPHLRSPLGSFSLRKGAHIVEYAVLAGLLARGFDGAGCEWMGALYAFAAAVAFGASDELHQVFVPGRHGTLSDLRYDAAGVLTGLIFYWVARAVHGKTTGTTLSSEPFDRFSNPPGMPPRS